MTNTFEPYGAHAIFGLKEVGEPQSLTMNDGTVVDPLFLYEDSAAEADREYIEVVGDIFHEIVSEGIYDEGIHWAELSVVRFNMSTKHPTLGDIVISIDHSRPPSRANLNSVNPNAKFPVVHRTRLHIIATASEMPGVILQNQGLPLYVQSDHLNEWPLTDNIYRLNFRVPLERRDQSGDVVITLNGGAIRMGKVA